jgi:hypothetical protein
LFPPHDANDRNTRALGKRDSRCRCRSRDCRASDGISPTLLRLRKDISGVGGVGVEDRNGLDDTPPWI